MALYLPGTLIRHAHRNLSTSRATPRLTDYLVFKRALVLSGGPSSRVVSGTRSRPYQTALAEWTLTGLDASSTKYINPCESVLTKTGGWRGPKYASNGPDNAWGGWQSGLDPTPVVWVRGTSSPKEYTFAELPASDLARHFLIADAADESTKLPRLIDLAVWWLRSRDLEAEGLSESSDPQSLSDLVVLEVGLTPVEVGSLFNTRDLALDEN